MIQCKNKMGQESSLLPRNPYENYPNKLSNHNHNHLQQKFMYSGSEHYSNLETTNFNIKSKLNLSTSNKSTSTTKTNQSTTTLHHHNNTNNIKYNLYQEKLPTTSTLYGTCYINKTWKSNSDHNNNITIVDQIPKHIPPPPPLPCSQLNRSNTNFNTDLGFDRYQRIKKSTSRSSFASYTDYSSCYCSSNSSALSSASKKSQEKQANYLNHHLYIKSYLDILEEDEKAKKKFQLRPGIRNYTPKILNSNSSLSNSSTAAGVVVKNQKDSIDIYRKDPDIWI